MAKPKPFVDLAPTATTSTSHLHAHESASYRPRRRAHSLPRPSSNLLALLATVAASSSSADGRPLSPDSRPPDFLCPFLPPHFLADHAFSPRHASESDDESQEEIYQEEEEIYQDAPTPTRVRRVGGPGAFVPARYTEDVDGRWRKEHSWSLYGSTYCDCTTDTGDYSQTAQTAAPEVDDQEDPAEPSTTSSATALPSSTDMTATLPPGWSDRSGETDTLTPYILILALILAIFISILIFGCVAWRRKRRGANKDVEKKLRKQRMQDEDSDLEVEIDEKIRARAQQRRLWVKATARWRPNVKILPRRRRKKASVQPSGDIVPHPPADGSVADASMSTESLTLNSSPAVTRRASTSSLPSTSSLNSSVPDGETAHADGPEPLSDGASHDPEPLQPPDYRDDSASNETQANVDHPARLTTSGDVSLVDGTHTAQLARPSLTAENQPPHHATAHIATDDKSLLARMATWVSSPPGEDLFVVQGPSHETTVQCGPSVPVIEELEAISPAELETFESDVRKGPEVVWSNNLSPSSSSRQPMLSVPVPTYSREPTPPPPLFPSPPSKAQLAAPHFYEYPSVFEADAIGSAPDMQPSAPIFEYASAPEDDLQLPLDAIPCAPPLIDEEDELHLGLGRGSAPPSTEDAEETRVNSEYASPSSSGAPIPYRSSHLERTTSPPDYLP